MGNEYDELLVTIADYAIKDHEFPSETLKTARYCLLDSIGCAVASLSFPACTKLLGSVVDGMRCESGARVIGRKDELDPAQAAFNLGTMIRWLDYNDTWLAKEWGHPSDNFGAIIAVSDFLCQRGQPIVLKQMIEAAIVAYEIQGVIALGTAFNEKGFDHVILVRIASTAAVSRLLGFSHQQTMDALSLAWVDGGALRTYRHAPNAGSRKSWAAGDACRRAVQLCLKVKAGEMGYPSCITTPVWGVEDVMLGGDALSLTQPLENYVMDNILFKVGFPAEFHAQTAVEAALTLRSEIDSVDDIKSITIETHASAKRIIDKQGELKNPADRDHCMQYMVAIALIYGELNAVHYEDDIAADPRVDALRKKITLVENKQYSEDYYLPSKRAITNSISISLTSGVELDSVTIEYPLGHCNRREEAWPKLLAKFEANMAQANLASETQELAKWLVASDDFLRANVSELVEKLLPN